MNTEASNVLFLKIDFGLKFLSLNLRPSLAPNESRSFEVFAP